MKIVLSENDIQKIKDAAIAKFKAEQNINIAPDLWPTLCHIISFVDFMRRHGISLSLEYPTRQYYQSVDED